MKVKLYMDVYKGQDRWFGASSHPAHDVPSGCTRFHFTVDIPDNAVKFDEGLYTHVEDIKEVK